MTFRIAVVLSPRDWAGRLHAFIADHVSDVALIVVRDSRAAVDAAPDVLLLDEGTAWLDERFVAEAGRRGVRLVGVYDASDACSRVELESLGLTYLIEQTMPPADIAFLLDRLRPSASTGAPREPLDPVLSTSVDLGGLLAVGGASGSGAREVAVGVSTALALRGRRTLLADLNETTPGVARRLGLPVYPHVLSAIDRLGTEGLDGVLKSTTTSGGTADVLVGLASTRDWDRLTRDDVDELLDVALHGWDEVVTTTSPIIEDLRRWGDRFANSRHLLGRADLVIGCVEPSPRGVLRYLDWLAEAQSRAPVITVVNKLPTSRWLAAEVRGQLVDIAGEFIADIIEVPFDRRVASAEWNGCSVARGPFCKAMHLLADLALTRVRTTVGSAT